jgi:hypothetical protein
MELGRELERVVGSSLPLAPDPAAPAGLRPPSPLDVTAIPRPELDATEPDLLSAGVIVVELHRLLTLSDLFNIALWTKPPRPLVGDDRPDTDPILDMPPAFADGKSAGGPMDADVGVRVGVDANGFSEAS